MGEWQSAVEDVEMKKLPVSNAFGGLYKGKTVLVTGHTGFKGSWLTAWLISLGAKVVGYSAYLPSEPCNFTVCNLGDHIASIEGDIRDVEKMKQVFLKYKPDAVFHLAAQPIVGGDDPYSASKACAEIACHSYIKSFFQNKNSPRVATTRAGNVIGGGDWADARIIPDCVRAWAKGKEAYIRNPNSTRPWQHVLEPLSGYLWLGANLFKSGKMHGEAFNFGPDQKVDKPVAELIEKFVSYWGNAVWKHAKNKTDKKESILLKLSCDKALHLLDWHAVLSFEETVKMTADWYKRFYNGEEDMYAFSINQIKEYTLLAEEQNLAWVKAKF